jgi:hypothetical protein
MSAGIVGIGIAVTALVSGGVEDLAGDTAELSGFDIRTPSPRRLRASVERLLRRASAVSSAARSPIVGFGEVLQLGPGEMTQATFEVPEGATSATLTFDMLGIDDLSGEGASIMINGQEVALYADNHGTITTQDMGVSGITVSVEPAVFKRSRWGRAATAMTAARPTRSPSTTPATRSPSASPPKPASRFPRSSTPSTT